MSNLQALLNNIPQEGIINWIGIRPAKKAELNSVKQAEVSIESGLIGDHYTGKSRKRQVTFIQAEHLQAVASFLQKEQIDPRLTRRNIVVSGINLLSLKEKQFQIGEVILETTGLCHPCSRMEENLGEGGYVAMRGHGGITTKVIRGGSIKVGDVVKFLKEKF